MDKELLIARIKTLCKEKGVTMTQAFVESNVGKNFNSNLKTSNPSKKNLSLLAEYFGCSVEYLTGVESEEDNAERALGMVMEWLEDNEYTVTEDDNAVLTIEKDGESCYYPKADFMVESLAIKATAQDGFELAMLDWHRRNFSSSNDLSLTEEERYILDKFRSASREGKAEIYRAILNICEEEEKKPKGTDKVSVG